MNMIEKLAHLAAVIAEEHERKEELILENAQAQQKIEKLEAHVALLEEQVEKAKGKSKEKAA